MLSRRVLPSLCLLLALALPNALLASLAEDPPEVVFTPRIQAKAAELGNDPVRIYEFVRNELAHEMYFGLLKGPDGTLVSGGGNDYDLAALLVSLLRAAGTPARFVRGKVAISFEDIVDWSGFEDADAAALAFLNNLPIPWNETPVGVVLDEGALRVRLHHVWVEAEVPMARYRGAGGDPRGKAWIPLDPSFKRHDWPEDPGLPLGTPPLDFDFDGPGGLYTKVHPELPAELFENEVRAYLAENPDPGGEPRTVGDVLFEPTVDEERPGVLPTALPFEVLSTPPARRAAGLAELHENPPAGWPTVSGTEGAAEYRWKRSVHVCGPATSDCVAAGSKLIEAEEWSAGWEGKRVLLHFPPASSNVPESTGYGQCNGTDGQPIRVTPTLEAEGQAVATAPPRDLCTELKISVVEELPALDGLGNVSRSDHTVGAGGLYLMGFDSYAASPVRTAEAAEALVTAQETFPISLQGDEPYVDEDGSQTKGPGELFLAAHFEAQKALTGGLLHLANVWYYERGRAAQDRIAALYQQRASRRPSTGVVSAGRTISYAFEFPFAIEPANLLVDIKGALLALFDRSTGLPPSCCGGSFELTGHHYSALEHAVWEEIAAVEAVSTVKGFQLLREGFGRELLVITSLAEAVSATASCSAQTGTCSEIDLHTYCAIKESFANAHPWRAPSWDGSCPNLPAAGEFTELRVMDRSFFDYHSFSGHVFYRTGPDFASYTIAPDAGGGHATNFSLPSIFDGSVFQDPVASQIESYLPDPVSLDYLLPWNQVNTAADPVSIFNGSYFTIETDLEIPGPGGMDLRLVRSYSSRLDYAGPLGHGWIHTYDQHLELQDTPEGDRVVWLTETGTQIPWDDPSPGTSPLVLDAQPWSHDVLRRNADGSYTLTTKRGTVYGFDAPQDGRARLLFIRDRNGNQIECSYDAAGRLDSVTDAAGRVLDFTYDAAGHLREIDDDDWFGGSGGRRWRYTVDSSGDLVAYMDPVQSALDDADPGSGQPWRYTYYADTGNPKLDHNLQCWIKPEPRSGGETPSPCGAAAEGRSWMFFEYYRNDTVYRHTDALGRPTTFSYNYFRKRTDVTHPDGSTETHFYDRFGNVTRFQDPNGAVREFDFDAERRERTAERDAFGRETTASYDTSGNLVSRTDRLGSTEAWTYNAFGQRTSHTDRRGSRREWHYDARGNLLRELAEVDGELTLLREHRYDAHGNRIETVRHNDPEGDPAPTRTRFEYGAEGVGLVRAVDGLGKIVRFENDPLGRPIRVEKDRTVVLDGQEGLRPVRLEIAYDALDRTVSMTDPGPVVREVVFDANGLVVQQRETVPHPELGLADPLDERTTEQRFYDAMDRLVASLDALGNATTFGHDARDRVVRVTTPLGRSTRLRYDRVGNLIEETDPSGAVSRRVYDAAGRLVRRIDPLGRELETQYDPEGRPTKRVLRVEGVERVLEETEYDAAANPLRTLDGEGHETLREFDELGRVTEITLPTVLDRFGDPQTAVIERRYDLAGRLIERVDAEGRASRIRYDRLGRLLETEDGLGRVRGFRHDEVGNLVARTDPTGSEVHFVHDDRGLLLRRHSTDGTVDDRYVYDAFGRRTVAANDHTTLVRRYDALDRVVAVTDPLAGTAQLVYDPDGRMVQQVLPAGSHGFPEGISVHYQYDARDRLASIFDPVAGVWRFEHDAAGRLVRRTDPNGFTRAVSYTPEGFVDTVEVRDAAGSLAQRHRYRGYDALGNAAFLDRDDGTGEETTAVTYDAWSRVREVAYGTGETEELGYDRVGNRTYHDPVDASPKLYTFDAADQLVARLDEATGTPERIFVHDAAGRLAQERSASGVVVESYTYDALHRLTRIGIPGLGDVLFYDAEGRRRLYAQSLGTDSYDFGPLGTEWQDGGAVRRVEAGGLDQAVAEVRGSAVVGLYRDGTGNVTATSDATQVTGRRTYTAFGEVLAEAGAPPTRRGFASLTREGQTPFLYARARHYDQRHGRFLQRDPLGIEADHLYAYAANNPYRFRDPLGLAPSSISGPLFPEFGTLDFSDQGFPSPSSLGSISSPGGTQAAGGTQLFDFGISSQSGVAAGQGVAKFVGVQSAIAGDVRAAQDAAVRGLDPFDNAGRSAIKESARARTPLLFRDLITSIRPGTDARPGSFGSANVPNARVSLGGSILRVGGRAVVGASLVIDAGRIFISSDRARTAVQVGFGTAGAFGGGALGILGGSALAPGPGTFIGGVGGAAIGGAGGEAFGGAAFDFFLR